MEEDKRKRVASFFTFLGGVVLGDVEKVEEMLDRGENVNGRFIDFEVDMEKDPDAHPTIAKTDTPLLVAVKSIAHTKVVQLLLERGADSAIKDEDGKTALEIANERKLIDIVRILEIHQIHE